MSDQPPGVMAAPNRCEIEARVLAVSQSGTFSDKWDLELEILGSKALEGPNFAHAGKRVLAFAIGDIPALETHRVVTAEAEFLGDPRGGRFRLSNIKLVAAR